MQDCKSEVESPMKHHTPTPTLKFQKDVKNYIANRVEGLGFVFKWLCLHCWRMPLHFVLWVTCQVHVQLA